MQLIDCMMVTLSEEGHLPSKDHQVLVDGVLLCSLTILVQEHQFAVLLCGLQRLC